MKKLSAIPAIVTPQSTTTMTAAPAAQMSVPMAWYLPPMEKLQSCEDWGAWLQTLTINARILGLWNVTSSKDPKPEGDDENKLQEWEQKDLCAMGLIINSLSLRIRVKLVQEGFSPATMTSKDLLMMVQIIVL